MVSVVIPTYNYGRYVCDAVDSALAQAYPNIEVIVVDDGSTDDTRQRLQRYGDRITYIYQENIGPGAARNTGIRSARGEWIALLDADDLWLPEKTAKQAETFLAAPELDVVFGLGETMDANGNTVAIAECTPQGWRLRALDLPFAAYVCDGDVLVRLVELNIIWQPTVMMRRKAFLQAGGYDPGLKRSEDYELWLRLAARGCKFGIVGSILHRRRQHREQSTQDREAQYRSHMQVLDNFLTRDTYPPQLRESARRASAGTAKVLGDYAFARGDTKKARAYYRQAMRYWPRPAQRLSWALTLLGSIGRRGARLLNRGSDIF